MNNSVTSNTAEAHQAKKKVEKLLLLALGTSSKHEAASAMEKANLLIQKYGIVPDFSSEKAVKHDLPKRVDYTFTGAVANQDGEKHRFVHHNESKAIHMAKALSRSFNVAVDVFSVRSVYDNPNLTKLDIICTSPKPIKRSERLYATVRPDGSILYHNIA